MVHTAPGVVGRAVALVQLGAAVAPHGQRGLAARAVESTLWQPA